MQKAEFEGSPSGRLVPTERNQWAFVPNPLPPFGIDLAVVADSIAEAAQALGELNGIGRTLPDPYLLIRPLQAQEALTSSSMEGTYTTLSDLLLVEAGAGEQSRAPDTREVLNYRRALAAAIDSLDKLPLSVRTLCDAHRTLLHGVIRQRGANVRAGEFKQHQNFIGAYEIENARFVPPPPGLQTEICMSDLEKFIHRDDRGGLPALVDAALVHYQFETIHPFADGNGRVGRMLITLHLLAIRIVKQPILYLSPTLERRKDEYIDRMYNVSKSGDWIGWVRFFLEMVTQSCHAAIATADRLLAVQREYRARLQKAGRSANLLSIADLLFRSPILSIPQIAQHLGVTYRAAQLNVDILVSASVLQEFANTSNPKFFAAREILDAISGADNNA
jgi:Fic family protein